MYSPENETFSNGRASWTEHTTEDYQSAFYYLFNRAYLHTVHIVIKIKEEIEDT